jgi:hypothetical protein
MRLVRCILPFCLAVCAHPAPADTLTDLLPPNTKVVLGIRVHNLAVSSVVRSFAAQAQVALSGWLKAVPLDGIDLLRDIDEVLIASSGNGQNPPAIIVVTGRFDVAHLAEGAQRYHEVPLLTGEKETDSVVALLDAGTALIGDPALVRAAIDQRGGKARIDSALNDRITSLRQRYDVWGLGTQAEGFALPIPEAKVLESIDRFQFGLQLETGLELSAEIHARSPEDADKLGTAFGAISAIFKGQELSASATRFDLHSEAGSLKLTVSIPEEQLKQVIEAETATLSPVSLESATPAPSAPSSPAAAEAVETGPDTAPEPSPAQAPATVPPTAPPAATPQATTPQALAKPAASKMIESDTVILMLPGKK